MSACPEKDIHSVYLDGELPAKFVAEYEAHVASCRECQSQLKALRELHEIFAEDSEEISRSITESELDKSFERLQARLSYSKFKKGEESSSSSREYRFRNYSGIKYFAAGIAAAAVLSFALPFGVKRSKSDSAVSSNNAQQMPFEPVARTELSSPSNQVRFEGNVDPSAVESFLGGQSQYSSVYAPSVSIGGNGFMVPVSDRMYYGHQHVSPRPPLSSYDVFAPDSEQSGGEENQAEKQKGFSFHISSPLADISLKFGN